MKDRLFLIAGVVGFYTFLARLTFDVAEGSALLPLAYAVVGVSLILVAIGYQKARTEWAPYLP